MAGLNLTRQDIDTAIGQALLTLNKTLQLLADYRDGFNAHTNQELLDKGYSQAEIDQITTAMADMNQLHQIYRGTANGTLPSPKDFRTTAKRLWGLGA